MHENLFGVVLDLLQLPHGRNSHYLVKNGVFKIWEQVINPEEIELSKGKLTFKFKMVNELLVYILQTIKFWFQKKNTMSVRIRINFKLSIVSNDV